MKTEIPAGEKLPIGMNVIVGLPAERAPAFPPYASLRATPGGVTIFALPRFVGDRRHRVCVPDAAGENPRLTA